MRVFVSRWVFVCAAMAGMAGCNTLQPIQDVTNAPVAGAANRPLTADQVRGAIVRAGSTLGWVMKDAGPGRLSGTIMLRTHTAVIEIPYSAASYSIKYKSSVDLNEKNGQIHRNYNGWITNLTRGINAQLAAA